MKLQGPEATKADVQRRDSEYIGERILNMELSVRIKRGIPQRRFWML